MTTRASILRVGLALGAAGTLYRLLLRRPILTWGATEAEASARLPGDELLEEADGVATRAITINAPPSAVWPWLMQIGQDRAGFYSYDWLEDLAGADIHNVFRLMPGQQRREPGDTVWMAPPSRFGGTVRMIVADIAPERAMVLISPGDVENVRAGYHAENGTWALVLSPQPDGATRLVVRTRSSVRSRLGTRLFNAFVFDPAHFIMERKMMLTIKALVEAQRQDQPRAFSTV